MRWKSTNKHLRTLVLRSKGEMFVRRFKEFKIIVKRLLAGELRVTKVSGLPKWSKLPKFEPKGKFGILLQLMMEAKQLNQNL